MVPMQTDMRKLIIYIFTLFLLSPGYLFSQDLISDKLSLDFIPEKAVIIVRYPQTGSADSFSNSFVQYQSLIIPPMNKTENDFNKNQWVVGTYIQNAASNPASSYNIYLKGRKNESFLNGRVELDNSKVLSRQATNIDSLKSQIANRKQILDSLLVQSSTQTSNLKRLRADAEVIANLSRIVEIVEESDAVKSEIDNINRDLELLKNTFQSVKNMPAPKNYLRRELELTKQSDEMIKLVKSTEGSEDKRKNVSQDDLQLKLRLIEETRYEDEEQLKQQLIRLKTHPASELKDQQGGVESPEPAKNYWETQ